MRYTWDETKRRANLAKHGLDLAAAPRFDWASCDFLDGGVVDGETRFRAVGFLDDRLVAVIGAEKDGVVRIISMRKATKGEANGYAG